MCGARLTFFFRGGNDAQTIRVGEADQLSRPEDRRPSSAAVAPRPRGHGSDFQAQDELSPQSKEASQAMNVSTSSDWPVQPFSLDAMKEACKKIMELDYPKEIRCSWEYFKLLRRQLESEAMEYFDDPTAFGIARNGLDVRVDKKMTGIRAEVHYRSGKIEDISPKPGMG
jgi:hypothetical protein